MENKKKRRKPGARAYADYPAELLNVAADLVVCRRLSSYDAEKKFGIPRRTILNRCKNVHNKDVGRPTTLTEVEEKHIADVVNISAEFGSPLTIMDLRIVVFNYLSKNGRGNAFGGKMPGERWARSFLMRHNFSQRATINIKRCRATKTVEEMTDYFNNLATSLIDVLPCNILNYDETNLSDDPGCSKAIFKRGTKHPERVLNSSKSSVSIMFAGTADGKCLPPYVVYKSDHLWTRWCQNGPVNARYNRTKSGWFDMVCFDDWFQSIVLSWASHLNGPKLVIGDNLSSHLSVETIKLCQDHDIRFVLLPRNSTHLTQPLDLAFFGPMKKHWRKILLNYKLSHNGATTLNKCHFPQLLFKLMEQIEINEQKNIQRGFAASGIYPFVPSRVYTKIPEVTEESVKQFDSTLLEYLTASRQSQPIKVARKKKLNIKAGKSVSAEEIDTTSTIQTSTKKKKMLPTFDNDTEHLRSTTPADKPFSSIHTSEKDIDDDNLAIVDITNSVNAIPQKKVKKQVYDAVTTKNSVKVTILKDIRFSKENTAFSTSKNLCKKYLKHLTTSHRIIIVVIQMFASLRSKGTKKVVHEYTFKKKNKSRVSSIHKNSQPGYVKTNIIACGELSSDEKMDDANESIQNKKGLISSTQNDINGQPTELVRKKKLTKRQKYVKSLNSSTSNSDIDVSTYTDSDIVEIPSDISDIFCTYEMLKLTEVNTTDKEKGSNETEIEEVDKLNKIQFHNKTDNETDVLTESKGEGKFGNKANEKKKYHKNIDEGNSVLKAEAEGKQKFENKIDNIEENLRNKTEKESPNVTEEKELQHFTEILDEEPYNVGNAVITRYYSHNSWKYYVGIIEQIDYNAKLYTISYFKTVGKKTKNIKFIKPKRIFDKDTVTECSIVKAVTLIQIPNLNQYCLSNDVDTIYFLK